VAQAFRRRGLSATEPIRPVDEGSVNANLEQSPFDAGLGSTTASTLAPRRGLIVAVVGLGFVFDYYEIIVQAITVRPALLDLGYAAGSVAYNRWVGWLMYLPFFCGGVLGLVGGYLTDRLGRRRVLVVSIVVYGLATLAAGYARTPMELLVWRCVTIGGVSVETVAALAWIAETFDEPRRREAALGYTQMFAGLSGFLVSGVYYLAVTYAQVLPPVRGGHEAWRYALLFGALPVVPVLVARLFLPESAEWKRRRREGTLRRPSFRELLAPRLRRATLVSTLLVACVFLATSGSLQQVSRMIPGMPGVAELPRIEQEQMVSIVSLYSDFAGLAGRAVLAVLAVGLLARRRLLQVFLIPAAVCLALQFFVAAHQSVELVKITVIPLVIAMVAMHSFIGNYLPQLYPVHIRGIGESVAYSIGGRIVGMAGAVLVAALTNLMPGATHSAQLANAAGCVGVGALLILVFASRLLPEPDARQLE
jgi:MFS family permease